MTNKQSRIQKLLSDYGYCSRRKAEELIKKGRVRVGIKTVSLGDKATKYESISVNGKLIKKQKRIYLAFNKPLGCVTAMRDKRVKSVMDYINLKERVFPVGRLDYNTSGLLLITNDGDFANNIMHPRYGIKKTYLAEIGKPIRQRDIILIEQGIRLKDGKTSPTEVKKITPFLLKITLHEGRNRIVRRIFEYLGYRVKSLKRIKIGNLRLGNLRPGEYRFLTEMDKSMILIRGE